jgi:hypothetical protein
LVTGRTRKKRNGQKEVGKESEKKKKRKSLTLEDAVNRKIL